MNRLDRQRLLPLVIALCAAMCAACESPSSTPAEGRLRFEYARLAMGVEARIVLYAPSRTAADDAANAAYAVIADLEDALSDWTERSAASHLAEHAGEGPIEVPRTLLDVLAQSLDLSRSTQGAFDPTIGPLVDLWRRARAIDRLPDPAEIDRARALVGADKVVIDASAGTVELTLRGMRLDFGAIGKGAACQRAIESLAHDGIDSALVQMGGDLVCSHAPPGTRGWSVDVPAPGFEPDRPQHLGQVEGTAAQGERLLLAQRALSISGDSEQWIEIDGVRRSHVIDPRSGFGLTTRALAVVVAPDGALSDALATAAGVLGPVQAVEIVARHPDCEARVDAFAQGGWFRRETPGFRRIRRVFPKDR
jgi:thiamine biosynthesis lipoprotein